MKAPSWLRRMQIWRVALVDRPANPDADIVFYKGGKTKRVDGQDLPASAFAHVGDPEDTSTWKLPVHDESHARNALARFNQTEGMSSDEKAKAKAKILAAAHKHGVNTEGFEDKHPTKKGEDVSEDIRQLEKELAQATADREALIARLEKAKKPEPPINQTPEPDEDDDAKTGEYGDEDDTKKKKEPAMDHGDAMMEKDGPGLADVHVPAGDIHKGADMETQADREAVAKLRKQLEDERRDKGELVARVEKMEAEQRRNRYIAKAQQFKYVPLLLPDDFASILSKVDAALTPEEREKFDKMLTATNTALRQAALFKEYGLTGHQQEGDPATALVKSMEDAKSGAKDPKAALAAMEAALRKGRAAYNESVMSGKER